MPKFVSKKNPFRVTTCPRTLPVETGHAVVATASTPVAAPAPQPQPPAAAVPRPPQAPATPGRVRLAWAGFRERTATFFTWLSHPRPVATKPAVPRFEPLPIQTELALDRIKVVRNDLSDADLELVPRTPAAPATSPASPAPKAQPAPEPAPALVPAPVRKVGPVRLAWNQAGRLLGAVKS